MEDTLITTREAARQLCLERRQVNNLLKRGKLRGGCSPPAFGRCIKTASTSWPGSESPPGLPRTVRPGRENKPMK